jgi:gas vesicle protein
MGGLLGASIALLFAPQTGRKTRGQLARYGKKAGTRAQHFVNGIAESLDHVVADVFKASSQGLEKGKQLTGKARTEILDVLDAGKKYLEEEKGKLEKILR